MNINSIGGRKFLSVIGCGLATTLLTWFDKIDGGVYMSVTIATVGAYIVGNVAQKRVEAHEQAERA